MVAFPVGAIIGFFLTIRLLLHVGGIFHDAHPSMQGLGYFVMGLAGAGTFGLTVSLIALTLPWKRPLRRGGMIGRAIASGALTLLIAFDLLAQGNALAFVIVVAIWLAVAMYLTYVRHGALDDRTQATDQG